MREGTGRCEGEKGKKGGGGAENLAFGGTEGGVLGPGKAGEVRRE